MGHRSKDIYGGQERETIGRIDSTLRFCARCIRESKSMAQIKLGEQYVSPMPPVCSRLFAYFQRAKKSFPIRSNAFSYCHETDPSSKLTRTAFPQRVLWISFRLSGENSNVPPANHSGVWSSQAPRICGDFVRRPDFFEVDALYQHAVIPRPSNRGLVPVTPPIDLQNRIFTQCRP
jgi:hypothetical protein